MICPVTRGDADDSEVLDFRAASECFAPVRKLTRVHLYTLHLLAKHQRREVPTVGGLLLFGKDRLRASGNRY